MTKKSLTILILAALTILICAGCGNDTAEESSAPEALVTFGVEINPSAEPSIGQTVSNDIGEATVKDPTSSGTPGGTDTETGGNSGGSATTASPSTTSTPKPATPATSPATSPVESEEPTDPPIISPPQPASNASADEAREYVGKTRDELIDALGLPTSSDYALIDENDPDSGEIGTLYFKGFTVTTKKSADGEETVTSVNVDEVDPEPDPE